MVLKRQRENGIRYVVPSDDDDDDDDEGGFRVCACFYGNKADE